MDAIEGYTGIRIWLNQPMDDAVFLLLVTVFTIFAIAFRANLLHFFRMLKDVRNIRERDNILDPQPCTHSIFYHNYLLFQAFLLCGIAVFAYTRAEGMIVYRNLMDVLFVVACYLVLFFVYFQIKQAAYMLLALIFISDQEEYHLWKTDCNAIMGLWGITLYVPVYWMVLANGYLIIPAILFAVLFFMCRLAIVYNGLRIFWKGKFGFIYICLYLCALEILPLMYLYKGMILLCNFIETNTLWH